MRAVERASGAGKKARAQHENMSERRSVPPAMRDTRQLGRKCAALRSPATLT
jgi:hypothetical protein